MMIGAAKMVQKWGRTAVLSRAGVELATFKARRVEIRPEEAALVNSVDQARFILIAAAADLDAVGVPLKFDTVVYEGQEYTIEVAHGAGQDVNELIKMRVYGGVV